jgi:hypothetical protein
MIIRGTTPYHNFILPIVVEDIKAIYVTYLQNEEVILNKSLIEGEESDSSEFILANLRDLENASMEQLTEEERNSCQLTLHLSQEDTLAFHFYPAARKNIAVIQIRILTVDDEAFASMPINERIFGVLLDGVIPLEEEDEEQY